MPSGIQKFLSFDLAMARVVAICLSVACPTAGAHAGSTELDLTGFQPTFEDTFQFLSLSARGPDTRWTAHTPWHGDFGDAVFDDPGPDGPFKLTADGLRIVARKDQRWHSGLICSVDGDGPGRNGFSQRYGYFEMRARLPAGPGVWPAFWLIGTDKREAASEIDVLEFYGAFPGYYHNVAHLFRGGKDVLSKDNIVSVRPGSLSEAFHTYGVLIDPDRTRFFLDRTEVWAIPTPIEYHQPMYILVDLAIGGGWPSDELASPAVMDVSYVKVFQRKDAAAAPQQAAERR